MSVSLTAVTHWERLSIAASLNNGDAINGDDIPIALYFIYRNALAPCRE